MPVLRNTEDMDFAGVEKAISHYGKKVKYSNDPHSVPVSFPASTCCVSLICPSLAYIFFCNTALYSLISLIVTTHFGINLLRQKMVLLPLRI